MRVLPPVEEEIRRIIRDERAKDPLITVSGLEQALEKRFQPGFSRRYVAKVADKVARQALVDIDRMKIEERLDFTRENYRMMREELSRSSTGILRPRPSASPSLSPETASKPPRTSS
jgi:hypothetical protein